MERDSMNRMPLELSDFERARQALEKADVRDCKLYLHHTGVLIAVNDKGSRVISTMPLESPEKPAGEFK